jgi:hypothetical protein
MEMQQTHCYAIGLLRYYAPYVFPNTVLIFYGPT